MIFYQIIRLIIIYFFIFNVLFLLAVTSSSGNYRKSILYILFYILGWIGCKINDHEKHKK